MIRNRQLTNKGDFCRFHTQHMTNSEVRSTIKAWIGQIEDYNNKKQKLKGLDICLTNKSVSIGHDILQNNVVGLREAQESWHTNW